MQYMTPYVFLFLFILDKTPKGLKTALYMCDVFFHNVETKLAREVGFQI